MSRRARLLVPAAADVERFDWTAEPGSSSGATPVVTLAALAPRQAAIDVAPARPAMPMPAAAAAPAGTAATPVAAPVNDDSLMAEHRERLAALEREAFTKGYAQGERAGLEAGGKRAEAMLRRVAQTLEELGGLRQSLVHETEREMVQHRLGALAAGFEPGALALGVALGEGLALERGEPCLVLGQHRAVVHRGRSRGCGDRADGRADRARQRRGHRRERRRRGLQACRRSRDRRNRLAGADARAPVDELEGRRRPEDASPT